MSKFTLTIEDLPEGGCWLDSDPKLPALQALAQTPEKMTQADAMAMAVWSLLIALVRENLPEGTPDPFLTPTSPLQ